MTSRRCKTCGITKPLTAFRIAARGKYRQWTQYRGDCKKCEAAQRKERRKIAARRSRPTSPNRA